MYRTTSGAGKCVKVPWLLWRYHPPSTSVCSLTWKLPEPHHFKNFLFQCKSLSHVWLFATPWTAAHQASPSITNFQNLLRLMSIEPVMPSNISSSVIPFSSCLQSLPASGSFPMSQFFASGGQSIGASASASASVLPMNIQGWFPLGLTGWISLQSKGPRDSQESSPPPPLKSINSSVLRFLYSPTLTSIHDYWKNHSLD